MPLSIHRTSRLKSCQAWRGWLAAALWVVGAVAARAQEQAPLEGPLGPKLAAPLDARQAAPFDPTGYWVSIISQDWIYRMVVMRRGEYAGIPINGRARAFADDWSREKDEAAGLQCEAYGAAQIMREPERLHISWLDDNTLQVQTDSGMQTRLLYFHSTPRQRDAPPSRQGFSQAHWELHKSVDVIGGRHLGPPPHHGRLEVSTTNMLAGLLRKNGVPYSDQTTMSESWVLNREDDGAQWLVDTYTLHDPVYLSTPYVLSSVFLKEPDDSKWHPTPCSLRY
jgi:hypothetical protein